MYYENQFEKKYQEEKEAKHCGGYQPKNTCKKLPGTLLRIFIPAGAEVNLGFLEVSSPSGICLIVRIPLLGGLCNHSSGLDGIMDSLRQAGATVEVVK